MLTDLLRVQEILNTCSRKHEKRNSQGQIVYYFFLETSIGRNRWAKINSHRSKIKQFFVISNTKSIPYSGTMIIHTFYEIGKEESKETDTC